MLWSSEEAREQHCAVIPLPAWGAVPGTKFKTWTMPCLASWLDRKINLQPHHGGRPRFHRTLKSLKAWLKEQQCCCSSWGFHLLQTEMKLGWPRTQGATGDLHLALGDAGCKPQPGTESSFSPWPQVRSGLLQVVGVYKEGNMEMLRAAAPCTCMHHVEMLLLCVKTPGWEQADLFLEAKSRFPSSWRRARISPRPAGLPGAISYHISISVSPWLHRVNTFRQWKDLHLQRKDCWITVLRKRPAPVWSEGNHPALFENSWRRLWHPAHPTGAVAAEMCSSGSCRTGRWWRLFPKAMGDVKGFLRKTRPVSTTTTTKQWDFKRV